MVGCDGVSRLKSDPYGTFSELRPKTASIVYESKNYKWKDKKYLDKKKNKISNQEPMNIYEAHLGSWKRKWDGGFFSFEELYEMIEYVKDMGYTHIELMPIVEYPLDMSWGYQSVGYYATTSRHGKPHEFKAFVDKCHEYGLGIILDFAYSHFCKDIHGLYKFDGSPQFEYEDPLKAENLGWGTVHFDLGKPEVNSFLLSNVMYWFKEFHIDGIRVDAVSSILYLDYDIGDWRPNQYGGRENIEGINFLRRLNEVVYKNIENPIVIAEESTSWPMVTAPTYLGGLGFSYKWNMGWMNDTLEYIKLDPIYRKYHHNNITFSIHYNYTENFILPISHDEVVHGKGSLIAKMYGDDWNKYAGLRLYLAYMMGHPGKKLTFMGTEFGQFTEWKEEEELYWSVIDKYEVHKKIQDFSKELNKFYLENKSLWELDYDRKGFTWIDGGNTEQSIFSFVRNGKKQGDMLLFICNFTPMVYYDFMVGVPYEGEYVEVFNTDEERFGGSGQVMGDVTLVSEKVKREVIEIPEENIEASDEIAVEESTEEEPLFNGQPYTIKVKIPPMAVLVVGLKK